MTPWISGHCLIEKKILPLNSLNLMIVMQGIILINSNLFKLIKFNYLWVFSKVVGPTTLTFIYISSWTVSWTTIPKINLALFNTSRNVLNLSCHTKHDTQRSEYYTNNKKLPNSIWNATFSQSRKVFFNNINTFIHHKSFLHLDLKSLPSW